MPENVHTSPARDGAGSCPFWLYCPRLNPSHTLSQTLPNFSWSKEAGSTNPFCCLPPLFSKGWRSSDYGFLRMG